MYFSSCLIFVVLTVFVLHIDCQDYFEPPGRSSYGPDGSNRRRPLWSGASNAFRHKLQRIEHRYRLEMEKVKRINFQSEYDLPYDITDLINASYTSSNRNYYRNAEIMRQAIANNTNFTEQLKFYREDRLRRREEFGRKINENIMVFMKSAGQLPPKEDAGLVAKLDTPLFYSVLTPAVEKLAKLFIERGYEIRMSGGSVRDLLNGVTPFVLDFTTSAQPGDMEDIFRAHNFQIIGVQGVKRHTFSLRLDNTKLKVATLRRNFSNIENVEYVNEWQWDAIRRDFTFNALFLGMDGSVYDYTNGYNDLLNKVVHFIGNPSQRIFEDYLRIVRYFRFFNRIVEDPHSHDPDAIKAITDNTFGLIRVSGKRLWREFKKVFSGKFIEETIKKMLAVGLSEYLGLGQASGLDIRGFERICRLGKAHNFRPISYIGALFNNQDQVLKFSSRMHLMADDLSLLTFVVHHKSQPFESVSQSPPSTQPSPPPPTTEDSYDDFADPEEPEQPDEQEE